MLRLIALFLAACAAAWFAGFLWFVYIAEIPQRSSEAADGIVVLTGGADRIAAGLRLLQEGRGHALLISGVGKGADLARLGRAAGVDAAKFSEKITLGRIATTTTGNAEETAAWVAQQNLHSLLVVTASYHMMRAMTELERSVPGVRLIASPVLPPALRGAGGLSTVRLLASEYSKFLASEIGLTRLVHES